MNGINPGEPEYAEHCDRVRRLDARLGDEVAGFTGITSVLAWMQATGRAKSKPDIVGQDEFHYDFQVELEPGGRWIVFGVT